MNSLRRTALYDEHVAAGARLVPFAGWEMPVQYSGVINEVRAVREHCGVFDVSHMGQILVEGTATTRALNDVISADWSQTPIERAAYALLLNTDGGVLDDIMGYRLGPEQWFIVTNASRAEIDEAHLKAHLPQLTFQVPYANRAMLALQGPRAEALLQPLVEDVALAQMQWRDCAAATLSGAHGLLARGGYTGSDGFEFMFNGHDAPRVWQALLDTGVTPCGLGARDVLRLEAGLPLYGHELREAWTPFESGCGWAVKFDKGDFIGRTALESRRTPERRIRGLKMQGRAIPREGYPVSQNGETIGEVTSGSLSPTIGCGIALAMLAASVEKGERVDVLIRGVPYPAEVVPPPFVAHGRK
ncbi:MAG TPA: glycine cleavage system aminomethyltransferase GcvT [Abditibacteriaceae bacterium]|nr:glycine cleavage system aminomethyltransferase GcvT [Abditibacteriaceae bacterium]